MTQDWADRIRIIQEWDKIPLSKVLSIYRLIIKEEVTPLIWNQSCKSLYSGFVCLFLYITQCAIFFGMRVVNEHPITFSNLLKGFSYDLGFMTLTDTKIWCFLKLCFFLVVAVGHQVPWAVILLNMSTFQCVSCLVLTSWRWWRPLIQQQQLPGWSSRWGWVYHSDPCRTAAGNHH